MPALARNWLRTAVVRSPAGDRDYPRIPARRSHLVVLARDPVGYSCLARALSEAHLAGGEKGSPRYDLDRLAELAGRPLPLSTGLPEREPSRRLSSKPALSAGGPGTRPVVERLRPREASSSSCGTTRTRRLVHATTPSPSSPPWGTSGSLLRMSSITPCRPTAACATVLAAVRSGKPLDELDGWLPAAGMRPICGRGQSRPGVSPGIRERSSSPASSGGRVPSTSTSSPPAARFPRPGGRERDEHLRSLVEERVASVRPAWGRAGAGGVATAGARD